MYWYQFFTCCEELVPIFDSVKFTNCEICGSTLLCMHLLRTLRVFDKKQVHFSLRNYIVITSLTQQSLHTFGCSKEPPQWDGSFEYPQHMFRLRNKKTNFQLHTFIWRPDEGLVFHLLFVIVVLVVVVVVVS